MNIQYEQMREKIEVLELKIKAASHPVYKSAVEDMKLELAERQAELAQILTTLKYMIGQRVILTTHPNEIHRICEFYGNNGVELVTMFGNTKCYYSLADIRPLPHYQL